MANIDDLTITVRVNFQRPRHRPWRERLFSWPWRPLDATGWENVAPDDITTDLESIAHWFKRLREEQRELLDALPKT